MDAAMTGRSPAPIDYAQLIALSAIWGASFLFIKVGVATIPPMTLVAARLCLAALGLLGFLALSGARLPRDPGAWTGFALVAAIGNVVPFLLISWGEVRVASGLAAILMSPMPLLTVLLAHVFTRDDRLTPAKLVGVALGVAGIVVLVGPGVLAGLGREVVAQLAIAAAGCCYAVANVYARTSRLVSLPPAVTATGVLVCAAVISLPLSLIADRPWTLRPAAESVLALVVLALLCTSAANLILFRLLASSGASFTAQINYLIPVFGVVWGALVLSEAVGLNALVALGLILLGVGLAQVRRRKGVAAP